MESKNKIFITKINSREMIYDSVLRIEFNVKSESSANEIKLRVRSYDPFFNINYSPYYHDFSIYKNNSNDFIYYNYFFGFDLERDINFERLNYRGGVRITFEDLDTNEIILDETFKFNFKIPEFRNKRIDGENLTSKRLWIIGDSNVWTSFGGTVNTILNPIAGYIPVRYTHPSLTLHKFLNGNYLDFLNILPVKKEDVFLFYLGDSDLRYSTIKTHFNKKIDLEFLTKKLVCDYFNVLNTISENYKDNKILIMSPNPPCRDNHIKYELSHYVAGTESDRLYCYNLFKMYCKKHVILNKKYQFIDWTDEYTDKDGLSLNSKFYPNDFHIQDCENLINYINNFFIENDI